MTSALKEYYSKLKILQDKGRRANFPAHHRGCRWSCDQSISRHDSAIIVKFFVKITGQGIVSYSSCLVGFTPKVLSLTFLGNDYIHLIIFFRSFKSQQSERTKRSQHSQPSQISQQPEQYQQYQQSQQYEQITQFSLISLLTPKLIYLSYLFNLNYLLI